MPRKRQGREKARCLPREDVGEGSRGRAGRERAPPGTESARTLVPDFGLHDCDDAHPVCGILLWWPELTETPGGSWSYGAQARLGDPLGIQVPSPVAVPVRPRRPQTLPPSRRQGPEQPCADALPPRA